MSMATNRPKRDSDLLIGLCVSAQHRPIHAADDDEYHSSQLYDSPYDPMRPPIHCRSAADPVPPARATHCATLSPLRALSRTASYPLSRTGLDVALCLTMVTALTRTHVHPHTHKTALVYSLLLARSTAMSVVFVDVDDDEHVDDMEDSSDGSNDVSASSPSSETEWSTGTSVSSDGTWQCSEDGSSQASEVSGDTGDDDDGEEQTDNAQSRQRKRARVSDGDSRPGSDTDDEDHEGQGHDDDQADNVSVIPHDAANEGEQKKEDEAVGGTEQEDEEEDEADGDDEAEVGGEDAKKKTDAKEGGKKETERKENEAEDETGEMTTPPHHSDRAPVAVAAPRRPSVATDISSSLRGFRDDAGPLATDGGSARTLDRWFKQTKMKNEHKMDEEENEEENVEEIEVENEDEEEAKRLSEITESYEVQQRVLNNLNAREQEQQSEFRADGRFRQLLAASRALVGRPTAAADDNVDEFDSEEDEFLSTPRAVS